MLSIEGLDVRVGGFTLQKINLRIEKGEYFVVLGVSGAGKSLLLETIAGIISPEAGSVFLNGADITHVKIQHRQVGLVYQDLALFPHMTVRENIAYPLRKKGYPKSGITVKVEQLAADMNIIPLLDRKPGTLSGGEQQRVALARTLALDPAILLLDEPLASLDVQLKSGLRRLLRKINQAGMTIMHVTHDYEEAVTLASKVAVLHEGQIIQSGATQEVFHHPKSEFIANFMGVKNFFEARVEELIQDDGTTLPIGRITNTIRLILQPQATCGNGFLMIRGEDITLSNSRYESSAVNNFEGIVTEIVHGPNGMEITVDTGIPLTAIITGGSLAQLGLREGKSIWLAIKASAVRFIPG